MKGNLKQIQKHRHFSDEFKKEIVSLFEKGNFSVGQLSKLHSISETCIYRWIYRYSTVNEKGYRIVEHKSSTMSKVKALEKRIKELEQAVGQKQIKIDYLEKMIDIAKDEFQIDIKKNFNAPQSIGSVPTKQK